MGVAESLGRGRTYVTARPGTVLVGLVGLGLLADLFVRLATGMLPVSRFLTLVLDGLLVGLVVGLAGVGLSMTYSILNFANFSHGDLVTSGAFVGWTTTWLAAGLGAGFGAGDLFLLGVGSQLSVGDLSISVTGTPLAVLLGAALAAVGTVVVALVIDRVVYRPMRDQGGIALLIASVGVALALRYVVVFVWGASTRGVTAVNDVGGFRFEFVDGLVTVSYHELTLVAAAAGLMVAVHLLLQRTKLGKAMRAMADNEDLARVTGIPTERVVLYTWIIGAGLAGIAGYLVALERGTIGFQLGWVLLLLIFAAVILGGIGSIYGAIAGGLIIGLTETLSLVWLPSDFTTAAAFGVMILVLLFRPEGIFGGVSTA